MELNELHNPRQLVEHDNKGQYKTTQNTIDQVLQDLNEDKEWARETLEAAKALIREHEEVTQ